MLCEAFEEVLLVSMGFLKGLRGDWHGMLVGSRGIAISRTKLIYWVVLWDLFKISPLILKRTITVSNFQRA